MDVVSVKQALAGQVAVGNKVEVRGWVRTRRDSKAGISFIHVTDGSCQDPIQVVGPNTLENYQTEVLRLSTGSSLICRGTLVQSQGKGQSFEIQADEVIAVGFVDDPETYPMQPKQHTAEFLREQAHLRPRTNTFGAVARIRHAAAMAIHRFFNDEGFAWVNTPIVTASDAEGAGQMFRVSTLDINNLPRSDGKVDFQKDFFGKEAYLTVSGQLNVEAYCLALSKVYTFGPTFRAENSNTSRHLAEFWMIEPEIAFADLNADADLAERFLKAVFRSVLAERSDDLKFLETTVGKGIVTQSGLLSRLEAFVESSFERIEYTAAIDILKAAKKKKFEYAPEWGKDLQTEHERYLTEEHIGRPVVVMNYPEQIKAFYMRMNEDGKTVAAMDVLAPGIGEIIGGSQREERLDRLDARMRAMNLVPEHYGWYRDLRRYGSVPHAGFGLGFERLIVYICGLANIRDAIPYPRVPGWAQF
jgi:asparaginyl-tRNA synthetase